MTKKDYSYIFLFYILNSALIIISEMDRFIELFTFNFYFTISIIVLFFDICILIYTFFIKKSLESLPGILATAIVVLHSAILVIPTLEYAILYCEDGCSKIAMFLRVIIIEMMILTPLLISNVQIRRIEKAE